MARTPKEELQEAAKVMARLAAMPHKPHIDKSPVDGEKKDGGSPVKKPRRSDAKD
ncbi:hypothetical protein [Aestuariivirga sp.]|uniref:hypothetical protein n=1 Tax=Aestuariivirga sp. TaxID=2650926 RepID=UPI003BAD3147